MVRVPRHLIVALTLLLAVFAGGWAETATVTAVVAGVPLLRIVPASSDAPAIVAYLNGQRVVTARQSVAVTPDTTVSADNATLQALARTRPGGAGTFLTADVDLRERATYTALTADRRVEMASVGEDDPPGAAYDGQGHVRRASPRSWPTSPSAVRSSRETSPSRGPPAS